jgi:hypothetical protein
VRIRVEHGGGLAGIPISNEMEAEDLPSVLMKIAKNHSGLKGIFSSN